MLQVYMNRQVNTKLTKQIRLDTGWHKILKIIAAQNGGTIKDLVEACLSDYYSPEDFKKINVNERRSR